MADPADGAVTAGDRANCSGFRKAVIDLGLLPSPHKGEGSGARLACR